jgi:choline dehydrogenase-like flavoprotein
VREQGYLIRKTTEHLEAYNGQVLYRGIPEDYDNWAAWGNTEWSYAQALPYFRKLENDHDFGGEFHGKDGPVPVRRYQRHEWLPHAVAFHCACVDADFRDDPDQNHPESTGVSARARNTIDGVRISMAMAYLDPARHRLNLTVKGNVMVRRLLFDGTRAVGIEVESGGKRCTAQGGQIVLSGGAIGSPHVLLLSGVGPGAQLQGSYLQNDMQISPMLMSSEHRPIHVPIGDDDNYVGFSCSLQLALSAGEVRLTSPDPHVQPWLDDRHLTDPSDAERLRQARRRRRTVASQGEGALDRRPGRVHLRFEYLQPVRLHG